jgi:hypothetical protein
MPVLPLIGIWAMVWGFGALVYGSALYVDRKD